MRRLIYQFFVAAFLGLLATKSTKYIHKQTKRKLEISTEASALVWHWLLWGQVGLALQCDCEAGCFNSMLGLNLLRLPANL